MDLLDLFSTPILVQRLPDMAHLNVNCLSWINARRAADPEGIHRANAGGGWHSTPDLALRRTEPCGLLLDHLVAASREALGAHYQRITPEMPLLELGVQAWAMVLEKGGYVVPHDHVGGHWSGVYYVDSGDADSGGMLSFLSPVTGAHNAPGLPPVPTDFTLTPETGMLVLFPAWLKHCVHPYQGARPRVAVSFNLSLRTRPRPAG